VARRLRDNWIAIGLTFGAFVLRARTVVASFETMDERTWMLRSDWFMRSLRAGELQHATAATTGYLFGPEGAPSDGNATMPGITTIWLGNAARVVWSLGTRLGVWEIPERASYGGHNNFVFTRTGLDLAQLAVALTTSVLIGMIVVLVARWVSWTAAAVAGGILASEPFLVAHGAVFHTDELVVLFGVAALVATALMLGLPQETPSKGRRGMAVTGGVLFGAAFLTKLSALTLVPGLVLLGGWAALRTRRAGDDLRPIGRLAGWWAGASAATVVLLYPALWVNPVDEVRRLVRSATLAGEGQQMFFMGRPTMTPGPAFYLTVFPLRVTPWLLAGSVASVVIIWSWSRTRGFGILLALTGLPVLLILSLSSKQFDRYALIFLVMGAIMVGVVVSELVERLGADAGARLRLAGGVGLVAVLGHGLAVAPWGLAYYNPLAGGSDRALRVLPVGWGEGTERGYERMTDLVDGECDGLTVLGALWTSAHQVCGEYPRSGADPDYVILYVTTRQGLPDVAERWTLGRELVAEETIRGIPYVQIYGPRQPPEPALGGASGDPASSG
jgi:hypothetical protein